jgi:hypothetical protein
MHTSMLMKKIIAPKRFVVNIDHKTNITYKYIITLNQKQANVNNLLKKKPFFDLFGNNSEASNLIYYIANKVSV